MVLGGAKVSDKLAVIEALLPKVDHLLIGGGMCYTFLKALGYEVGSSLLEADMVDTCRDLLDRSQGSIVLPVDIVVAGEFAPDAEAEVVPADGIPADQMGLDTGPTSVAAFAEVARRRPDRVLERPVGRLRVPALRGRDPGAGRGHHQGGRLHGRRRR